MEGPKFWIVQKVRKATPFYHLLVEFDPFPPSWVFGSHSDSGGFLNPALAYSYGIDRHWEFQGVKGEVRE